MKRNDESYCKERFNKYIAEKEISAEILWEEVNQVNEPPDYFLLLNGQKFAVEITQLIETLDLKPKSLSPVAVSAFYQRFVTDLEEQSKKCGALKGLYLIELWPLDNFVEYEHNLIEKALEYIVSTQELESAPPRNLLKQQWREWRIQKLGNHKNHIGEAIHFEVKCEPEAIEELCNIADTAIRKKCYKLRNVKEPKILLLLNRYNYIHLTGSVVEKCAFDNDELNFFHTIFIVEEHGGEILHTVREEWN